MIKRHFFKILMAGIGLLFFVKAYSLKIGGADIKLSWSLAQKYDDNVTFRSKDPIDDFVTVLSISGKGSYERKRSILNFIATLTQNFFAKNHSFNNSSQKVVIDFQKSLSKYSYLKVLNTFTHIYEPRSFEEAFGRGGGRYSYYRNIFNFSLYRDFTKKLSLGFRYSNENYQVSKEGFRDSYLNRAGLDLSYFFGPKIHFLLSYDFSKREFKPGRSSSSHFITLSPTYYFATQFFVTFTGGAQFIKSYEDTDYQSPLFLLSFVCLDQRGNMSLSFLKRYYTTSYTQDIFDYWRVSFSLSRSLSRRLKVISSAFYGEGKYKILDIQDSLLGSSIKIRYNLTEDFDLEWSYTYSETDSNIITREYKKNVVFCRLIFKF